MQDVLCLLMSGVTGPGSVPALCLLTARIRFSSQRKKQFNKKPLKLGIKVITEVENNAFAVVYVSTAKALFSYSFI